MAHRTARSLATTASALGLATGGVGLVGTGSASAETVVPMSRCWGVSPDASARPRRRR